jgi:hypothetical protein
MRRDTLEVVGAFGQAGRWAAGFYGAHDLAAESTGNLFIAESCEGRRVQEFVYRGVGSAERPLIP